MFHELGGKKGGSFPIPDGAAFYPFCKINDNLTQYPCLGYPKKKSLSPFLKQDPFCRFLYLFLLLRFFSFFGRNLLR